MHSFNKHQAQTTCQALFKALGTQGKKTRNNNNNNKTDVKVGATLPLWNLNSDSMKQTDYTAFVALLIKAKETKVRQEYIPAGRKLHTGGGVRTVLSWGEA